MRKTSCSTTGKTTPIPSLRPQADCHGFLAPRDEGAPYPEYSFAEAWYRLVAEPNPPASLHWMNDDLAGYTSGTLEHVTATRVILGVLFRQLERDGADSDHLDLCRAAALAVSEGAYQAGMIAETLREAILAGLAKAQGDSETLPPCHCSHAGGEGLRP